MNYADFTRNDFIEDTFFRCWVFEPNQETEFFWQNFMAEYPEKKQDILAAKNLLLAIDQEVKSDFPTQEHEDLIFDRIQEQLNKQVVFLSPRLAIWVKWAVAASVVLAIAFWQWNTPFWQNPAVTYETNLQKSTLTLIEKMNTTNKPLVVKLSDGSTVTLSANSKISYPEAFNTYPTREVYLSGEAFFEVAKNPKKQFLVYANEMVTKVLGTSFRIRAYPQEKDIIVRVKTGKVSVLAVANDKQADNHTGPYQVEGVLLLPNQQAILVREETRLVKSLVENPELLKSAKPSFVFTDTSVVEVLKALEKGYGIEIVFDEDALKSCQYTGDLSRESLYEKLDVICKSIEANYQILDTSIVVSSKGCE
ncbi:FecR family protein [Flectobacillus major]|uniref:FecR family protein n=1 Tax=Flectobacillus major TaxID=103 RepID=UPI00040CC72F|nr:FecR family protein [Flectobacillus major]